MLATAIALLALREARKNNRIALLAHRVAIYEGFRKLGLDALCQGPSLEEDSVQRFSEHATAASVYLPRDLAGEVSQFYEDCERVVWVRTLKKPVDEECVQRGAAAYERVRRSALAIEEKLLKLVREATDA